jgi:hypothetical protein
MDQLDSGVRRLGELECVDAQTAEARSPEEKEKKWCGRMMSPIVMWTFPRHATCHHLDVDSCTMWTPGR